MKKSLFVALIVVFSLSACVPSFLGGGAEEAPAVDAEEAPAVASEVDVEGTADAVASTQAAQTLAAVDAEAEEEALATPTLAPTDPPSPTATEELPTSTPETTETTVDTEDDTAETPEAESTEAADMEEGADEATATPEGTATAIEITETVVFTETPAPTATSVYPSATSPIAIFMPPEDLVPRFPIHVKNTTKGKVYISLQGKTAYDYTPVIEYDIPRFTTVRIRVPEGMYNVVVYVGKEPMVDYVRINRPNEVRIVIRKNELKIER